MLFRGFIIIRGVKRRDCLIDRFIVFDLVPTSLSAGAIGRTWSFSQT